ncbi:MAG: DUF11 domain-containing protein [Flavobacteriales bacterium]|nr:MAG: DUF11 domain-containing protein [Flavobacteriales bacterium]
MLRNFLFLFGVLCAGLVHNASAQLVFVPDINFRAALNNRVAGLVDANGYIDTQSFAVQTAVVLGNAQGVNPLLIDWTPADLTGLEGLVALYSLAIDGEPGTMPVVTLPVLPSSLHHVHLRELSINVLPAWPAPLETFAMIDIDGMAGLPPLAPTLTALHLEGCDQLAVLPTLPSGLDELSLRNLALLTVIPNWPVNTTAIELDGLPALAQVPSFQPTDNGLVIAFRNLPVAQLPAWPQGLEELTLMDLPNVVCLSALPNSLLELNAGWDFNYCLPNIPPNVQVFLGGFQVGVGNSWLCTLVNSNCPPGAPVAIGSVFLDSNGNGLCDSGELPYTQASLATSGTVAGPATDGTYSVTLPIGSHAISCIPNTAYVSNIAPATHTATFIGVAEVDSLNHFAITLQPNIQDLVVDLTLLTPPVPGFYSQARISYINAGTQVENGSVTLIHDALLAFSSSTPSPDNVNVNVITWNFTQLQIGEQRAIDLLLYTPVGTLLSTVVSHTAVVDPSPTDETPSNNSSSSVTDVVGSYDPNDKAVSPTALTPAQVAAEERLTYTIRFQNTGTWPATRVVLTDTLSTDLQWNTMQEIAASHAHTWHIADGVLHVVFDNIMLPDSNANEPGSHGFFKSSMKPVSTLMLGDAVSNIANIYFDFNEPVITNAAVFTVDNNVAVAEVPHNGLHLSPNPTSDVLTVRLDEPADRAAVHVMDVTGRTVLRATMSGTRLLLDVETLRAGSYTVRVGEGMVGRFVKR